MENFDLQFELDRERRERYMNEAKEERVARQERNYKPTVFSQVLSRRSNK